MKHPYLLLFIVAFSQVSLAQIGFNNRPPKQSILNFKAPKEVANKTQSIMIKTESSLSLVDQSYFASKQFETVNINVSGGHKFVQALVGDIGFVIGAGATYLIQQKSGDQYTDKDPTDGQKVGQAAICAGVGMLAATALVTAVGGSDLSGRFWPTLKGAFVGTLISLGSGLLAAGLGEDPYVGAAIGGVVMVFAVGGMANRGYYHW